jgi:solute carrier family 25 (mitochondrial oxoglutarate transporter), member 11
MQGQLAAAAGEKLKYTGLVQTLGTIARTEGVRSLWKGFTPYFARSGGHTVLMFIFKEYYDRLAAQHYAAKP